MLYGNELGEKEERKGRGEVKEGREVEDEYIRGLGRQETIEK